MPKFNLSRDKLVLVSGVVTSFTAGDHDIKDEEVAKALRGAKDCAEVTKATKSKAAE